MPAMVMDHAVEPTQKLREEIGDVSNVEIFNNYILVGVYIRPNKTKSGLYLSDKTTDEDRYQGKVGLVLKKGPDAFVDTEGKWFRGVEIKENDWIVFRPSDGWQVTVNGVLCRMLEDTSVKGSIDTPDRVY